MKLKIDLKLDLIAAVKEYFTSNGIAYENTGDAGDFAMRYFEMRNRLIAQMPRRVFISEEVMDVLGQLANETADEQRDKALEAWRTVWHIRNLFVTGGDLVPHLSKRVKDSRKSDPMLWDYGMHHFHLNRRIDASGFVKRSDYLLFAIVTERDAYFVDIVKHYDPGNLLWVRQRLLEIVAANFPEIAKTAELRGVTADSLSDEDKKKLRDAKITTVVPAGQYALGPIGGGILGSGNSVLCRMWGDRTARTLDVLEEYLFDDPKELREGLEKIGIDTSGTIEFKLVRLDSLDLSEGLAESLIANDSAFGWVARTGFAVVEGSSSSPVL